MAKTKYERFVYVYTKEQAQMIKDNLKDRGVKAYYVPAWVVMIEVRE